VCLLEAHTAENYENESRVSHKWNRIKSIQTKRNQMKQFWADGSLGWDGWEIPYRVPCKSQMTSEHIVD